MRLKPTTRKTWVSLVIGLGLCLILFLISFLGYKVDVFSLVAIFIVASVLSYLIWSMFQPEYYDWE